MFVQRKSTALDIFLELYRSGSELKRRLSELPKSQEIVAYCRGPYCVFSDQAVELPRAKGFQAVRLDEGILDWRARGLPVAIGERP